MRSSNKSYLLIESLPRREAGQMLGMLPTEKRGRGEKPTMNLKFKPFRKKRVVWETTEYNDKGSHRKEGEPLGDAFDKYITIELEEDVLDITLGSEHRKASWGSGWGVHLEPAQFLALRRMLNAIEVEEE